LVGEENPRNQMMFYLFTDADFLSEYGIETVAGRGFLKERASDVSGACMVNEASVKAFGWSSAEEAVGKRLETGMTGSQKQIIGVTKDFHYRSLHFAVEPLVIEIVPTAFQNISFTVDTENLDETVSFVEETWRRLFPGKPFEYFFLDGFFQLLYRSEQQVGRLFTALTVLGIFIACLGLFGLASFMSQQRTKEIGIRKVLGATVTGIVHLISKEFLILVALANVIAWPVAYYAMSKWLQNFAYRIDIGLGTFLLAGLLALLIALITVAFQAVKAALANPVEALRYE
jgi:putative ABC transport system permease protein